jgi:prepilin-type N-terminal cleavage/methylation domain-containing protein
LKKFTLIELLVVVAIIGILTSILLPSLQNARESVKVAVCVSNQKQFGIASMMMAEDLKGIMIRGAVGDGPTGFTMYEIAQYLGVDERLTSYNNDGFFKIFQENKIYQCPSYRGAEIISSKKARSLHYLVNSTRFNR